MLDTIQDRNKATIRAHFQALDAGDAAAFGATHAADGINHAPAPFDLSDWPAAGKPFGPMQAQETLRWLRSALTDLQVQVEELIAERDQVVAWVRLTGGSASGRPVDSRHAHRFRLRDALIVEHWAVRDDLRAMLQAGVVAPPAPRPD